MANRRRDLSAPPTYDYDSEKRFSSFPKRRSAESRSVVGFGTQRNVTPATLKDDIDICKSLLFRNFTPRFKELLETFKRQLEEAEKLSCSENRYNYLTAIKNGIQSHLERLAKGDVPSLESLAVLQDIRTQKFLLDYADYLTIDLDRLRSEQCFRDAVWNETVENWVRTVRILERGGEVDEVDGDRRAALQRDLAYAASELKCDYDLLVFQIKTYAERNRIAHSNLKYLIANQQWPRLAEFINRDRRILPTLVPLSRYFELREFEKVLDRTQKKFFKVLEPSGHYELSDYAMNLRNELLRKKKEKDEAAAREEIRLAKKRRAAERSRQVSGEIEKCKKRREASSGGDTESTKEGGLTDDALEEIEEQLTLWEISHIKEEQSK